MPETKSPTIVTYRDSKGRFMMKRFQYFKGAENFARILRNRGQNVFDVRRLRHLEDL